MKTLLCLLIVLGVAFHSSIAQSTTLTLQPDSVLGKDAIAFSITPNDPGGSYIHHTGTAWTWSGTPGIIRSFIEFDLSSIPAGANLVDARLSLYSASSGHTDRSGNNDWVIQRVTTGWNEQTVTWNSQPTTTTQDQILMPGCTGCWPTYDTSDYLDINVTAIVQHWFSNPTSNFGFMMKLQTEQHYRAVTFASSDEPDNALHPKLVITYEPDDTCTVTVFDTTFVTVNDTNTINIYDTTSITVYDTSTVTVYDTATISVYDTVAVTDTLIIDIPTGLSAPYDINTLKVYPNPTASLVYIDNGNHSLLSNFTLKITDSSGQQVFSSYINVPAFTIDFSQFGAAGIYFLQIIDPFGQLVSEKKIVLH